MRNALEALGIRRSEDEMVALCKTTPDGTTPRQIMRALSTIEGVINATISEKRSDHALLRLLQSLYEGRPVILLVDSWEHYAVAVGVLGFGKRVICVDSGSNDLVHSRTLDEVVEWWGCTDAAKPFFGVIV